uniref:Uncharacterized protein n=1 Tax=Brassica oleracea var. oleracea TaxID=109376 RepID=A0A0D3CW26_BRAOL
MFSNEQTIVHAHCRSTLQRSSILSAKERWSWKAWSLYTQKCTTSIRVLAYGTAADTVDEYLWLGGTTTRSCLENFVDGIIYLFGDEYLRRPTPADLQRLLDIGEYHGFSKMIGSIDCTLNDINVPDRSHVFDDIIKCQVPQVTFSVNEIEYHMVYYLTDGEDTRTSHVDLTYSTDILANIANMVDVRTRIRDRQIHQQLKDDLVEHVWLKFGRDEDNN